MSWTPFAYVFPPRTRLADQQNENEGEFKNVLQRVVGKVMVFNCRAKQETFNVRAPALEGLR